MFNAFDLTWPTYHFSSLEDAQAGLDNLKKTLAAAEKQRLTTTELVECIDELESLILQCELSGDF